MCSFKNIFLVLLLATFLPRPVVGNELAEFRMYFKNGQCAELDAPLRDYRSELRRLGRINLQVDYMLSVCRCRIPGLIALKELPSVYRYLTSYDQDLIREAIATCNNGTNTTALVTEGGAIVFGKGGQSINGHITDASADIYASRIFSQAQLEAAKARLKEEGFDDLASTSNFIVTGDMGISQNQRIATLMEDVLTSFLTTFELQQPKTLTTVYIFADEYEMEFHAMDRHGIRIPAKLYAYTFPQDSSITIRRSGGLGTVGHEVFHVLLNQSIPYAPPWLNEGTAALFEEFQIESNKIVGAFRKDHWRVIHLKKEGPVPLKKLLDMNWQSFDGPENMQVNHATAKFLAMYLQEQDLLSSVLHTYAKKDLFGEKADTAILEMLFKSDIDLIASTFADWLRNKLSIHSGGNNSDPISISFNESQAHGSIPNEY